MLKFKTNSISDVFLHVAIIVAAGFAIFLFLFFFYLPWRTNHGDSVTVPDLKGMTIAEAERALDAKDLEYEISDSTFVLNAKPLSVFNQYPKANTNIKEGRKIYLTIITDKAPLVAIPDVLNRSFDSGKNQVASYGFVVDKPEYIPALEENTILSIRVNGAEVTPGRKFPKGSKVTLVVGDGYGDQSVVLPNLVGMPIDEAEMLIAGMGLRTGNILYEDASIAEPGVVVKQRPEVGNKQRLGDVVDIWVAGYAPPQDEQ